MKSNIFFKHNALLGEGIHWDKNNKLIWFVDIHSKRLNSLTLDKKISTYELDQKIGWVLTIRNKKCLMVGMSDGIAIFDPHKNKIVEWVNKFNENVNLRLNDAKADKNGNIWGGVLNDLDETKDDGYFYLMKSKGEFSVIEKNYLVPNGPIIFHEENYILHSDSAKKTIFKYEVDFDDFYIQERSIFKKFNDSEGYPDGMTLDSEGNIYVAMWGEGKIRKLNSKGDEISNVQFPAQNITNVCFCGEHLNRLIVTSARSSDQDKIGGSIFEITGHGMTGLEPYQASV